VIVALDVGIDARRHRPSPRTTDAWRRAVRWAAGITVVLWIRPILDVVLVGILAISRVDGTALEYRFLWRAVIAIGVVLGAAWAVFSGTRIPRALGSAAVVTAAAVVVLVSSGTLARDMARTASDDTQDERATAELVDDAERHGVPDGGVILRLQESSYHQLQRGILDPRRAPDGLVTG
jgi:hypothetical protein